jgi:hypothetical protein
MPYLPIAPVLLFANIPHCDVHIALRSISAFHSHAMLLSAFTLLQSFTKAYAGQICAINVGNTGRYVAMTQIPI